MKFFSLRNYQIYLIAFLAFVMGLSSCDRSTDEARKLTVENLLSSFNEASIQGGRTSLMFNDPLVIKKHLGGSWFFKEQAQQKTFPWPCFSEDEGHVFFWWSRKLDRRISIKLLNIHPEFPYEIIEAKLNDKPIISLNNDSDQTYNYLLPAELQKAGKNILQLRLTERAREAIDRNHLIPIHSVAVTNGAALIAPITINNEIRPALMMSAPISVQFEYDGRSEQVLEFDYSVIRNSLEKRTEPVNLSIHSGKINRGAISFELEIPPSIPASNWQHFEYTLTETHNEAEILSLILHNTVKGKAAVDYLAISEMRLKRYETPAQREKEKSPDILILSTSNLNCNRLPCYGNHLSRMSNLDQLVKQGNQFSNAITPVNCPASWLYSVASGMMPSTHNYFPDSSTKVVSKSEQLEQFRKQGYRFFVFCDDANSAISAFSRLNGYDAVRFAHQSDELISGDDIIANYSDYLSLNTPLQKPVCAWLHVSYQSKLIKTPRLFNAEDYRHHHISLKDLNLPKTIRDRIVSAFPMVSDAGGIFGMLDDQLHTLDTLIRKCVMAHYESGRERDLIILFTTSNGIETSIDNNFLSTHTGSQNVIHVPLVFSRTNRHMERCLYKGMVSNLDILPLLLNRINFPEPDFRRQPIFSRKFLISENCQRPIVIIHQENWKMIYTFSEPYIGISKINLFNLNSDPGEKLNLAGNYPDIQNQLRDEIFKFTQKSSRYPTPMPSISELGKTILESLNYVDQ